MQEWLEIETHTPTQELHAVVPGSKSTSLRALLLAACVDQDVTIENLGVCDDTDSMIGCLRVLGVTVEQADNTHTIRGNIQTVEPGEYTIDVGLSGLTLRFMVALCATINATSIITGEPGIARRPYGELVDALRDAGANIELNDVGCVIRGRELARSLTVDGSASSQYVTSLLLMCAARGYGDVTNSGNATSASYTALTLGQLRDFGVEVAQNEKHFTVTSPPTVDRYHVEPDASSAAYPYALGLLHKQHVIVKGFTPETSIQPDAQAIQLLQQQELPSIIDCSSFPDQAMTLAALAALRTQTTTLTGLATLRVKESNRIEALQTELEKIGATVATTHDTVVITGTDHPVAAQFDTYGDHRMAMSMSLIATIVPGCRINDPGVVSKTFPEYWDVLESLGWSITYGGA